MFVAENRTGKTRYRVDAAKMDHPAVPDDDVSSLAAGLLLANAKIATLEQALHQGHSLVRQELQGQQATFQKEMQKVREVVDQILKTMEQQEQRQESRLLSLAKDTATTIEGASSAIAGRIDHVEQLQQQGMRALEERMSALENLIRSVDHQNQQQMETLRERQQVLFLRLVIIQIALVSFWSILLFLLTK